MREHKAPHSTPRGKSLQSRSYKTGADRTLSKIGGDTKLGGGRAQQEREAVTQTLRRCLLDIIMR